jgi:multicomponent Na+:H+ antiporter subunit E
MKTRLPHIHRFFATVEFVSFYLVELLKSNIRVAHDVLTPHYRMTPALLHLPTTGLTDRQKFALANLVSMTPGTLSIDYIDNDNVLLIHSMYSIDPAIEIEVLQHTFIRRIKNVF